MKIAVPVAQGALSMHFGHCEEFAVVDVDDATKTVSAKRMEKPPLHEPGVLPRWLHELGVNVIIAGGMGQRAQALFAQNGIAVVVGAPSTPADEVVAAYLDGTLETGQNLCDH